MFLLRNVLLLFYFYPFQGLSFAFPLIRLTLCHVILKCHIMSRHPFIVTVDLFLYPWHG